MTGLNWNSRRLTHGWQRGVTAFYYGLGLDEADFDRAQVGIGVPLLDGNLCNVHAYATAQHIVNGCRDSGLIGSALAANRAAKFSQNLTRAPHVAGAIEVDGPLLRYRRDVHDLAVRQVDPRESICGLADLLEDRRLDLGRNLVDGDLLCLGRAIGLGLGTKSFTRFVTQRVGCCRSLE